MNTEIAIIQQENVAIIAQKAPEAFVGNQQSHDRCIQFGKNILSKILQAGGMNDELDKEAAEFIDRAKKTVRKMNENRSPVTKLFDEVRAVFTTMENDVDPTKKGSVPEQLQKMRNDYAAKKRAEAEAKRQEQERIQRIEAAKKKFYLDVENEFRQKFNSYLNNAFNYLNQLNASVTLQNYDEVYKQITRFNTSMSNVDKKSIFTSSVFRPLDIDNSTISSIINEVAYNLLPQFEEQYKFEMQTNCESILDMFPSKKRELEKIAQSGAEEAARRKFEMERHEAEEAKRREEERIRKENEEQERMKLQAKQSEMSALFDQSSAAMPVYQPKTQVKKKVVVNDTRGFLDLLNFWWLHEGCTLSVEELSKKFKPQITFCEKLANDKSDQKMLQSQYISYVDDVKAK